MNSEEMQTQVGGQNLNFSLSLYPERREPAVSFGDRLQALRRSNNLTQEEFAQQLKVSRQAVSKWESSRGYPEIEKIIYIPLGRPGRKIQSPGPAIRESKAEKGLRKLFHQPFPAKPAAVRLRCRPDSDRPADTLHNHDDERRVGSIGHETHLGRSADRIHRR